MKKLLFLLMPFLLTLLFPFSFANAVPNLISYQGVLNDSAGVPVSSNVIMTFSIYDVEAGGTALWSETQSVAVSNGVFNVQLGSVQQWPASLFSSNTLYLGIKVGADTEMAPRQRITAGAYIQSVVPIGTINAWAKGIPGVPSLPEGWVECNGQVLNDPQSPLNGQIIPDLNGGNRFLRGNATSGGQGGEEYHTLTIDEMPAHSHTYASVKDTNTSPDYFATGGYYPRSSDTGSTGGNQPHENRPPFFDVVWVMRVK